MRFIHQLKKWPSFTWDAAKVEMKLAETSFELGKFSGRLGAIGFEARKEAVCETLATEILNSSEIEGESLNRDDVRSSVATSRLLPGAAVESLRDESRELLLMIGKSINTASARLQGRKIEA